EIDGLRTLAVVPVVMFHMGLGFPGGFVGVDVFFVISGFLITGIIRRGIENETFSLAEFWERRIRRIFPALFVVVAATLAVGYWLLLPDELEELGKSSVAQALLLANVYFWRDTSYFAGPAEFKPLLQTWSLAVEEQFYLFFPLALCFLKRLGRKQLFALLTAVALISFVGSVYGAFFHTGATFFLLPTRAWELLIGCILAVFPWQCKSAPRRDSAIATLGMLAIVLPVFLYDSKNPFPGLAAAPPVLGTAAIIFATANTPRIWLCKVLSVRPFVFIGLISYSLYLWHWPVIVYTRMYFDHFGWKQIVFASVVSIVLAIFSWRLIETPFRRNTFLQRRRRLFGTAFLLSGTTVAVSIFLVATGGLASLFPNYSSNLAEDTKYPGLRFRTSLDEFNFDALPALGLTPKPNNERKLVDFVVWGDSHAMMLCEAIDRIAAKQGLTGRVAAAGGQVPGPDIVFEHNNAAFTFDFMAWMNVNRPPNLILVGRWSGRTNGRNKTELEYMGPADKFISDASTKAETYEASSEVLGRSLRRLAQFCEQRGITLWIIQQVPEIDERQPARDMLMYALGKRKAPPPSKGTSMDQHLLRQERVNRLFAGIASPAVHIVDPAPYLFDKRGNVTICRDGRSCYYDEDHLTGLGASLLAPLFTEMFVEMKSQKSVVE
ncbi:acyltransferase, partial [Rhodopirellula sp.]|nr:acyltransferase [Rhodopirellula sp.]